MPEVVQSPAATIPPEMVAHIVALALEGDPRSPSDLVARRRTQHALGRVCRSWSAEVVRLRSFTVTTAHDARLLAVKLARQEGERKKANGSSSPVAVSALVLFQADESSDALQAYRALLSACPTLDDLVVWAETLDPLLRALEGSCPGGVGVIRRLQIRGRSLTTVVLFSYLARLPSLETLDLSSVRLEDSLPVIESPSVFPHLRHLNLSISEDGACDIADHFEPCVVEKFVQLFNSLVTSTSSLRSLHISHESTLPALFPCISESLASVAPNLVPLVFGPLKGDPEIFWWFPGHQDDVLALLGTMKRVETLSITLHPDPAFFMTL